MRRGTLTLATALALLVFSSGTAAAQVSDSWLGTWKLNLAKSTFDPAALAPRDQTTKLTRSGEGVLAITDGTDAQGKKIHTEITYKLDGAPYEYKGAPDPKTTRVYTRIGDNVYQYVTKVDGTNTTTSRVNILGDGKTRTIVTGGRDAQGRRIDNLTFWDKQ